jgi:anti-anti-sigma regulatory factor
MSWQIKQDGATHWVVLDSEMCIQNAAEFYQAVLPLAGSGKAVRIDAKAAKSVHTSIMQILYALSRTVGDFGVTGASEEFRLAETRVGLFFSRSEEKETPGNGAGNAAVIYG